MRRTNTIWFQYLAINRWSRDIHFTTQRVVQRSTRLYYLHYYFSTKSYYPNLIVKKRKNTCSLFRRFVVLFTRKLSRAGTNRLRLLTLIEFALCDRDKYVVFDRQAKSYEILLKNTTIPKMCPIRGTNAVISAYSKNGIVKSNTNRGE